MDLTQHPSLMALRYGTLEARSRARLPRSAVPVTAERRAEVLADEIRRALSSGATVERETEVSAVLCYRTSRPNHLLHGLLTLLTLVLFWVPIWALVWLVATLLDSRSRVMVSVDDCGNVVRERLRR